MNEDKDTYPYLTSAITPLDGLNASAIRLPYGVSKTRFQDLYRPNRSPILPVYRREERSPMAFSMRAAADGMGEEKYLE